MSRSLRGFGAGMFVLATAVPVTLALTISSASALTTIAVTTMTDGGTGSLRAAFAAANAADPDSVVIELQTGASYVLDDCKAGALDHDAGNPLTITGNGSKITQTCTGKRVITNVGSAGHLTVDHVWITGGNLPDGTAGGGIGATSSGLTIRYSTLSGNSAGSGGAVFVTGGGDVTVDNSTIVGNTAIVDSGTGGVDAQGSAYLIYATIVGNTGASEGQAANVSTGGDLIAFGSVIAEPLGTTANCSITGTPDSLGFNYSDDASCDLSATGDTENGADPQLGTLADNGGGTPTALPAASSPLVDHVAVAQCDFEGTLDDQRGVARPQGSSCDTGAVEVADPAPPGSGEPATPPAATQPATALVAGPRFTG